MLRRAGFNWLSLNSINMYVMGQLSAINVRTREYVSATLLHTETQLLK